MPKVSFEREQVVVDCQPGTNLLEAAEKAGIGVFRGMWPSLHCEGSKGWCNRCKVWVKSLAEGAVNPPTRAERSPLRLNGRVRGTMRLACQVVVSGEVVVHTRAGGPPVKAGAGWEATSEPTKWKERWEKRKEGGKDDPEDTAEKEA